MHLLYRLLAVLRNASLSFRRLIFYLALRVPSLFRSSFGPPNCISGTLHSTDHSQLGSRLSFPTPVTTGPITSASSGNLTSRIQYPSPGNLHPSSSPCLPISYPPSSISQSTGNTTIQLFQNQNPAPSCRPSLPDQMKRYERTIQISVADPAHGHLKPGKQSLKRRKVSGWSSEVHPEGALFYFQKAERLIVLTDTDLTDQRNLDEIHRSVQSILEKAKKLLSSDELLVLVVELANEEPERRGGQECLYYFVDHAQKLLFWVHDYTREAVIRELCGGMDFATEDGHLKYAIEAQYWMHCERFSNMVPMRPEYLDDLRETLIHASTDTILSDTSVAPFAPDDLLKMLGVVTAIESSVAGHESRLIPTSGSGSEPYSTDGFKSYPHSISAIARIMRLFAHSKFLNFHGQPGARLNADQSIYTKQLASDEGFSSPVFYALDIMLLTAPRKHIRILRSLYVDHIINKSRWKGFITGLKDEWNGYTIFSTVMLAVDISFLAVPGVINQSYQTSQTPTAVTIYISTTLSLATLIVSLLLSDQIRRHGIESLDEGATYMARMTNAVLGVEAMAVMYGLPYALLIWSMVAFGVALSMMIFSSVYESALAVVATFFAFSVLLALWPLTCGRWRRSAPKTRATLPATHV
ncbi:hypothetical protein PAXRUDRAFT_734399 [Paxillus rubicundulus Ve08.2h10]|uniref:Unplaced genomic scaffold scaffold_874, whole genome shotgun sequence n=1 Tax=Paxillus rubicundulus Ve08.2h10 TaxID=930991 RepID=A0A0D0D1R4_9AGAM|nr:hypothetical protein PAXRUDRAFT_734399 [Paxillus rubicundulus Ve08.2h10]